MQLATECEQRLAEVFLGEPANTVTSFGFVLVGLAVLLRLPAPVRSRWAYGLLVIGVGVGSVIQHGPHPSWQAYPHDLTLAGVLAFVAVDCAADLSRRRLSPLWWVLPTLALVPVIAASSLGSSLVQALFGAVAVVLGLARAWARPWLRRPLLTALTLLGVGAVIGTLGERTGLCQPDSLLQGHAVWHLLAAAALWRLAPVIGARAPVPEVAPDSDRVGMR